MRRQIEAFERLCERPRFCLTIILLACLATVVIPVALGGVHASGDMFVYLGFGEEVKVAFQSGRVLPGWANDNLGYGSVGIRFYPPISFYTLALAVSLLGSWYYALWAAVFAWMLIGCWGVYLCLKEWGTPLQGVIGGCLYAIAPFHIAEIYQFSLVGEFAAGAILPYCLLYAVRICNRRVWSDVAALGIFLGFLVLTHIPTTIITSVSFGIFLLLLIRRPWGQTILRFTVASSIALATSAFYWVKVITELNWLAHNDTKYASGLAGYEIWLFPLSLFDKGSSYEVPIYYFPVFRNLDAMIGLTFLMAFPAIVLLLQRWKKIGIASDSRRLLAAATITSAAGFFMLSLPSSFVWATIPLLQKIQFPWRWLSVLSILAVVCFTISISRINGLGPNFRKVGLSFAFGLVALIIVYDIRQSFARPNTISNTEVQQMLEIRNSPAGTSLEAWWPTWARADALKNNDLVSTNEREVQIKTWNAESRFFAIGEGQATTVRIATFFYPHWRATVNGSNVEVGHDEQGAITLPIDSNASDVHLYFEEPLIVKLAFYLSATTIVFLFIWLLLNLARSQGGIKQVG